LAVVESLQVEAFLGHAVHKLVAVPFIPANVIAGQAEAPEMVWRLIE